MRHSASILASSIFVLAGLTAAAMPAHAQSSGSDSDWTLKRTPWGHPDLTGTFSSDDMRGVPLERPEEFGTRRFLTDEEFAEREANNNQQVAQLEEGGTAFLAERGVRTFAQTSLIVDPPNGRMPELTPAGAARRDELRRRRDSVPDSWLDRSLYDRCLTRGVVGSVLPVIYGNGLEIYQTPDAVVVRYEMIHETRIIHLDGREHVGAGIQTFMGDPVGHWEGDTLVVETSNFRGETGIGLNGNGVPTSPATRLTERFTRVAEDRIDYEVTIEDPETFTAPLTIAMPLTTQPDYRVLPYECHEGNFALANILSAARAEEAATESPE